MRTIAIVFYVKPMHDMSWYREFDGDIDLEKLGKEGAEGTSEFFQRRGVSIQTVREIFQPFTKGHLLLTTEFRPASSWEDAKIGVGIPIAQESAQALANLTQSRVVFFFTTRGQDRPNQVWTKDPQ